MHMRSQGLVGWQRDSVADAPGEFNPLRRALDTSCHVPSRRAISEPGAWRKEVAQFAVESRALIDILAARHYVQNADSKHISAI